MKKLARRTAEAKNELDEDLVYHLRVRIRYALLRSTFVAVRGKRGRPLRGVEDIESTSFNLIPETQYVILKTN